MRFWKGILVGAVLALLPLLANTAANAQKQGGTLRIFHRDSPANMSIYEEGTISVVAPIMPVFNNLVLFNQHEKQNRLDNIVPDLADSWSWSEDGKDLTFKLHQSVNWHDGKPFTAADVKCTWDLLQGKAKEKLRLNAREAWWANLDNVKCGKSIAGVMGKAPRKAPRSEHGVGWLWRGDLDEKAYCRAPVRCDRPTRTMAEEVETA